MRDDRNDVLERCKKLCMDHILSVDPSRITPAATFMEDLGADSLYMVELVMAAEEEFGIEITDQEAESWRTVQHAATGIFNKLAATLPLNQS